ncbi:MAG TPA: hypoxanthine phosphoribosyltransferase [Thermotogota bacterium]|nr:hypoxanthine phosphoribosyltransferase [Thermotogota bacterium]HRW92035.1 hypoxanthine phosphoribosyltransferase [Thermotogota bacterium]
MQISKEKIKVLFDRDTIQQRIRKLGEEISEAYSPLTQSLYMVCVLKGSIHFFSELLLHISLDVNYSFIQVSSYSGTSSTGKIIVKSWIDEMVQQKHVIVVEDILDTGKTLKYILNYLKRYQPKSLEVATLVDKYQKDHYGIVPRFVGFRAEDRFLLGYGLDFDQRFRNLPFIGYVPGEALEE